MSASNINLMSLEARKKVLEDFYANIGTTPRGARTQRAHSATSPPIQPLSSSPPPHGDSSLVSLKKSASLRPPKKLKKQKKLGNNNNAPELVDVTRFSVENKTAQIKLDIQLPKTEEEAIPCICNFFNSMKLRDQTPSEKVLKVILAYPNRKPTILKALQQVYENALKTLEPQEGVPTQRNLFFEQLLYIIAFNVPMATDLISSFFRSNLEEGCNASCEQPLPPPPSKTSKFPSFRKKPSNPKATINTPHAPPEFIKEQREEFCHWLFDIYGPKEKFIDVLAAILAVEIKDQQPETIFRGNDHLSVALFKLAISKCLPLTEESLSIGADKPETEWPSMVRTGIQLVSGLLERLKTTPQIKEMTQAIALEIQNAFPSHEELAKVVLKNFIILRIIGPHFSSPMKVGKEFAKFINCLASNHHYQINELPLEKERDNAQITNQNELIRTANDLLEKATPELRQKMDEVFTYLASDQ